MKLTIVTPSQEILSPTTVSSFKAVGPKGEFGLLEGHADYAVPLSVGVLSYEDDKGSHQLLASGGYVEVHSSEVLVVADEVERPQEIQAKTSRQQLDELEKRLTHGGLNTEDFDATLKARDKEVARLSLVK